MILVWLKFLFCTSLIVFSGYNLSRYGDVIAEKTGLGRTWIGVLLMAGATSLPELITGISSVTIASAPNIAVGGVMGSSVFNILIVAILDIVHGPGPVFSKADKGHVLSGGFGIVLLSLVVINIFLYSDGLLTGSYIGIYVPFIVITYLLSMKVIYRFEMKKIERFIGKAEATLYGEIPLRKAYRNFFIHTTIIVGAGTWLPFIGTELATVTGLGRTFVGNIFIALSTSLPEVVVSLSAVKIGAVDMAIGNLFGSNLFNMNILVLDDIFYTEGPILSHASPNHIVSGISAIMMTGVAIVGLTYRSERKAFMRVSWDGLSIIAIYCLNTLVLYLL